jgi:hypothetical protein
MTLLRTFWHWQVCQLGVELSTLVLERLYNWEGNQARAQVNSKWKKKKKSGHNVLQIVRDTSKSIQKRVVELGS